MTPSQPSMVNTTACNPRIIATQSGHPADIGGKAAADAGAAARAWPPTAKQATRRTRNATVFSTAVKICAPLPQRIPRHCNRKKPTITLTAKILTWPASRGKRSPLYSAMTMATAAAVPQVESQSPHPTINPAYSPSARRAKLYCPPLRGMAAPSSASEEAPKRAYRPPTTQTPMNNHALGKALAISPGVRTMPAAMEFPMAEEMPNHTPRTFRRCPWRYNAPTARWAVLVEGTSDVLDNVKSQESIKTLPS